MNSMLFNDTGRSSLLADLEAMADYLDMLKTADVEAVRPQLDAMLAQARRLLSVQPSAGPAPAPWVSIAAAFVGAATCAGAWVAYRRHQRLSAYR